MPFNRIAWLSGGPGTWLGHNGSREGCLADTFRFLGVSVKPLGFPAPRPSCCHRRKQRALPSQAEGAGSWPRSAHSAPRAHGHVAGPHEEDTGVTPVLAHPPRDASATAIRQPLLGQRGERVLPRAGGGEGFQNRPSPLVLPLHHLHPPHRQQQHRHSSLTVPATVTARHVRSLDFISTVTTGDSYHCGLPLTQGETEGSSHLQSPQGW